MNMWPIKGYALIFNPKTHTGELRLDVDADPEPDLNWNNIPAKDFTALAVVLKLGNAALGADGRIFSRG